MKIFKYLTVSVAFFLAHSAFAQPARLSTSPTPLVTIKNVDLQNVQDAIIGFMLRAGKSPAKQDNNILVYEEDLTGMQAIGVQMLQGNSGWQNPKGRNNFTMARQGNDVILSTKYETVAANMLNASNSILISNDALFNEQYLGLQFIGRLAENRIQVGDHLALGITGYDKPTRKTKKIGSVVSGVVAGGPADKAGIVRGDIVISIGGTPTAGQTIPAISLLGYLQENTAILNIQGKGDVVVTKTPPPNTLMRNQ